MTAVRLDHLLSKEEQVKNGFHCLVIKERQKRQRHKKQKRKMPQTLQFQKLDNYCWWRCA